MFTDLENILDEYSTYLEGSKKGLESQLKLQESLVKKSESKYIKERETKNITSTKTGTALKSKLIDEYSTHLRENILHEVSTRNKVINFLKTPIVKTSKKDNTTKESSKIILSIDMIASIVLDEILDGVGNKTKTTVICSTITKKLLTQIKNDILKEEQPGWMYKLKENTTTTHSYYKSRMIDNSIKFFNDKEYKFKNTIPILRKEDFILIGRLLMVEFIKSTGSVKQKCFKIRHKNIWNLVFTDEMKEIVDNLDDIFKTSKIEKLPMLIKPQPHVNSVGGGYITNESIQDIEHLEYIDHLESKLIRTPHRKILQMTDKNDKMDEVYNCLNTIQDVPFTVNSWVVNTLEELQKRGETLYSKDGVVLFYGDPKELPKLGDNPSPVEVKDFRKKSSKVHDFNNKTLGERVVQSIKIDISKMFSKLDSFYFPANLDYRSRIYPLTLLLNTQSDDFGKSLLQFSNSREVGKRGGYWLKYHLSNLFGNDKLHPDDRVKWVDDNLQTIHNVAEDPLVYIKDWIYTDEPFQFLAVCKEVSDMMKLPNPSTFKSRTAIAKDATNSGLQHWSAILRDEVGGKAVNLMSGNKLPEDVYKEVSNQLIQNLKSINCDLSKFWLSTEFINRSFCKRPTMTKVYGVTGFGIYDQIVTYLKQKNLYEEVRGVDGGVKFIRKQLEKAINEVVIAANSGMEWLQDVSNILYNHNFYIRYRTPTGFDMFNYYNKADTKTIETMFNKTKYKTRIQKPTDNLNKSRMSNGISPNFIHSLDASHLMKTCNSLKTNHNISDFWFIHDSFGVHPDNVDDLDKVVREEFVSMYKDTNVLLDLYHCIEEDLITKFGSEQATTILSELPPLPLVGELDISSVSDSVYFFN